MAEIRLYKKFVCISAASSAITSYEFITPVGLSASTTTAASNGTTIIETGLSPVQESLGIYYVDLNPNLYSGDVTYELIWDVIYVPSAPVKNLPTRFRINPNIAGDSIGVEILTLPLEIGIENNTIDIELG